MTALADIELAEWDAADPATHSELEGLRLSDPGRRLAEQLAKQGALRVTELATGLRLETNSYVGSVQIGALRVRIRPKISGQPLLTLLRYAYGFRRLKLYQEHAGAIGALGLQDLLILQMRTEAAELIARGLHRRYARREAKLASPAGRIDFLALAKSRTPTAGLPCRFHRRVEDTIENRALHAGLRLGAQLTLEPELRSDVRRLSRLLEDQVTPEELSPETFRKLDAADNRLVAAYRPFFRLLRLLFYGHSATLMDSSKSAPLPGFMLDMNLFFQDLVARFLHDYLEGYELQEQSSLKGIFAYEPRYNPRSHRPPQPRPDFVLRRGGTTVALLDAKYRDLWVNSLPRDILYQLTIYALSQRSPRLAVILYPTMAAEASEARVMIREPIEGVKQGVVSLHPVNLHRLAGLLVSSDSAAVTRERQRYARVLVLGEQKSSTSDIRQGSPEQALAGLW